MTRAQDITSTSDAAIISRMIHPDKAELHKDLAQAVLRLFSLDQNDLDRMHELAVKNQDDALTRAEIAELESYLRVSYLVDLVHAATERLVRKRSAGRCEYCRYCPRTRGILQTELKAISSAQLPHAAPDRTRLRQVVRWLIPRRPTQKRRSLVTRMVLKSRIGSPPRCGAGPGIPG